ncbi:MAG: hypothetical protein ACW98F_04110 [Candidatus Hodarchaeales archaeon]
MVTVNQYLAFIIMGMMLICGIIVIPSASITTTLQYCPVDVQILYFDDSWCSGTQQVDNSTLTWDTITITFITLGVGNLDTTSHSLDQVSLTKERVNEGGGLSSFKLENFTAAIGIPLLLSPHRYWQYNFSCSSCQSLSKIHLEVDGEWYTFSLAQLLSESGVVWHTTYWPPHWSKVLYYTVNRLTPVDFLGILSGIGIGTMIFMVARRRGLSV